MKKILILMMFFDSTAKAQVSNYNEVFEIINKFYKEFPFAKRGIFIRFVNSKDLPLVKDPLTKIVRNAHGTCQKGVVRLNKRFWKNAPWFWKKKLVYHELGHCALNLRHPKEFYEFTIMNSILSTADNVGSNWPFLVEELRCRFLKKS